MLERANLLIVYNQFQVIELTGRSEDEALFALHDVNYDLNIAVEKLLESADTQVSGVHALGELFLLTNYPLLKDFHVSKLRT